MKKTMLTAGVAALLAVAAFPAMAAGTSDDATTTIATTTPDAIDNDMNTDALNAPETSDVDDVAAAE